MALRSWIFVLPVAGMAGGVAIMLVAAKAPGAAPASVRATDVERVPIPATAGSASPLAPFEIDALEVSVGEYDACVRAGACRLFVSASEPKKTEEERHAESARCHGGRPDRSSNAMNCVAWDDADAYCRWVHGRLPTEAEWRHGIAVLQGSRGKRWRRDAALEMPGDDFERMEWTAAGQTPTTPGATEAFRRECHSWCSGPSYAQWEICDASCGWRVRTARAWGLGFRCVR